MGLPWRVRLSYAVGHVLNDLCASVWFTYTIIFFECGIGIPTLLTGTIVLLGQVVDGLATPIVGYFSDRSSITSGVIPVPSTHLDNLPEDDEFRAEQGPETLLTPQPPLRPWYRRLIPEGRKLWHFVGSLMVIASFPLLFGPTLGKGNPEVWAKMLYYSPLVIIFQVGWASIQISHLALLNDLTADGSERTLLTSLRHVFTVLSNMAVYLTTFVLLRSSASPSPPNSTFILQHPGFGRPNLVASQSSYAVLFSLPTKNSIYADTPSTDFSKDDVPTFQLLSFAIIGFGALMTLLFHIGTRTSDFQQQPALSLQHFESDQPTGDSLLTRIRASSEVEVKTWYGWLKLPKFWLLAFYYMTIRLIVNVSQAYITSYLIYSLHFPKASLPLVPLTTYLTSIVAALVQKPSQDFLGREIIAIIGLAFVAAFCVLAGLPGDPVLIYRVYIAAGLLGIGCTAILVTAIAMVSDLIGRNQANGAVVFGYMSFADKFGNGLAIQMIEVAATHYQSPLFYKYVESYGIGACVAIDFLYILCRFIIRKACATTTVQPPPVETA